MVGGSNRHIVWRAVVVGAVVMVERRNGQQGFRVEGADPGKVHKGVALMLTITEPDAWVLRREVVRSNGSVLDIVRVGIVRNLIVVLAQRGNEAELVGRIEVENQRAKASIPIGGIVNHLRNRRL